MKKMFFFIFSFLYSIESFSQMTEGFVVDIYSSKHGNIFKSIFISNSNFPNSTTIKYKSKYWYLGTVQKYIDVNEIWNCCQSRDIYSDNNNSMDGKIKYLYNTYNDNNCEKFKYCIEDMYREKAVKKLFARNTYYVNYFEFKGEICTCYSTIKGVDVSGKFRSVKNNIIMIKNINKYVLNEKICREFKLNKLIKIYLNNNENTILME